jgi:alpha-D-ribose 1-methylphosphonate 5-triphosphate diphosphatase
MTDHITILQNANIILSDDILHGWAVIEDGHIIDMGKGRPPERGIDLEGDYLIPGLIELHTDHLESHYVPRPKVRWHPLGAVLAYDAQIASSGITTVFDSLRAGIDVDGGGLGAELIELAGAIDEARRHNLLRSEHLTHLRCEIPSPGVVEMVEDFVARYPVGLMSLMDHTPGQRQFRDLAKYQIYYSGKMGKSPAESKTWSLRSSASTATALPSTARLSLPLRRAEAFLSPATTTRPWRRWSSRSRRV